MSEERLKTLARDIKEGRLEPAYLFEGDDEYRKLRALEAMKKAVVGESPAEMAFERLESVAAAEMCERARTAPFFVERRLLVGTGVGKYGDADLAALSEYAADPSSSAVVNVDTTRSSLPADVSSNESRTSSETSTCP